MAATQPCSAAPPREKCATLKSVVKQSSPERGHVDIVFHALADANRRLMLDRLAGGPASVSELARPLAISLPAVVQHLRVLEGSGLVRSHKAGRVRTCQIEPQALDTAERWISERREAWEQRLDRLGEFLAEQGDESGLREQSKNRRPR
jgi:DNA-binding transcriptional ArsR family regulator